MDDRTLLELAARALGWRWSIADLCWYDDRNGTYVKTWNPLTDDGDALRLAVKCRIDLEIYGCYVEAIWVDMIKSETHCVNEDWGAGEEDDAVKMRYVRRAVVRAAAAIGGQGK